MSDNLLRDEEKTLSNRDKVLLMNAKIIMSEICEKKKRNF